jgi:hypothetical protein
MTRLFLIFSLVIIASCSTASVKDEIKSSPVFTDKIDDPTLKQITEEFFHLSKRNNVTFKEKVTIGFSSIEKDKIIGTCTYGNNFREIDLDIEFWERADWMSKVALVYHEMAHCYCRRMHDFDDGKAYPETVMGILIDFAMIRQPLTPMQPPGYFYDHCPKSIMHPTILDSQCFQKHYPHYVKEMFARCEPF